MLQTRPIAATRLTLDGLIAELGPARLADILSDRCKKLADDRMRDPGRRPLDVFQARELRDAARRYAHVADSGAW